MSPEQVRGEAADHRSDIFSFGAMLYELLAGKRAFAAATSAEIMTAILREDPPELPPVASGALREIVRHCLEKEPAARFQSAKDLAFALRSTLTQTNATPSSAVAVVPATTQTRGRWWVGVAAGAAVCAAFAVGWFWPRGTSPGLSNYRFTPIATESVPETDPVWSPDGKTLAYSVLGRSGRFPQIHTRRLDSPVGDQITHEESSCRTAFWSRTGDRIYFTKAVRGKIQLCSIAAVGGASQVVMEGVTSAALAPDGITMAMEREGGGLYFGKLGGSQWTQYRKSPFDLDLGVRGLAFSPDGKSLAVLFTRINTTQGEIWLLPNPVDQGSPQKLFPAVPAPATYSGLSWMPDSRHMAVALSRSSEPDQLYLGDAKTGVLRQLTAGIGRSTRPAVSSDGRRIAFQQSNEGEDIVEIPLEGGEMRPVLTTARAESSAAWLPNGREFVYTSDANGPFDIWIRNPEDDRGRPLLPNGHDALPEGRLGEIAPAPDGRRIAFVSWSNEHTVWILRPSGGKAVRVDPENPDQHNPAWSPDGNWIAYSRVLPKAQLMKVPSGGGAPIVLATQEQRTGPSAVAWSPAGDWIAWTGGGLSLYSPDGKQQKKLDERHPHQFIAFSRDGQTLYQYYVVAPEGKWVLEAFDVKTGNSRRIGGVKMDDVNGTLTGFQLHPDGKRFLACVERSNPDIFMLEGF
jgi:Tol biopolymer transport system component